MHVNWKGNLPIVGELWMPTKDLWMQTGVVVEEEESESTVIYQSYAKQS